MSVCRSSRQLLRHTKRSISCHSSCNPRQHTFTNSLHTSSVLRDEPSDARPKDSTTVPTLRSPASVAAEKRTNRRQNEIRQIKDTYVPYTEKELKALSQYYTEEQMEALKAAEETISLEDLADQWGPRKDQWKMEYEDDLSNVDPLLDYQPKPQIGHAPSMYHRSQRQWAPEELELTARDQEIESMSEEQLKERFDKEFDEWEKQTGMDKLKSDAMDLSQEEVNKIITAMVNSEKPAIFDEEMRIEANRRVMNVVANAAIHDALIDSKIDPMSRTLPTYENDSESIEQEQASLDDDPTRAFSQMGPFNHSDLKQMEQEDMPEDYFVDHDLETIIPQSIKYQGLGITEMLYKIEKSKIAEEVKASLRPLYTYKGTHKEEYAKRILWPFITEESIWSEDPQSYRTIKQLFEQVQILQMDPIKKAELLAYSHWADTPKGDSLRPVLERAIESHDVDPVAHAIWKIEQKKKEYLGLDVLHQELPLDVEGPNKHLYSNPIYSLINPPIPRIRDPNATYTAVDDDALSIGLRRVSQQTGFTEMELRRFRYKNLVFHRVVNQTRKGKIQSMYALAVAGNEDGLLGIGEGKAFEAEDAMLKARLQAIRNVMPVPRYENRTIFGQLNSKVGGCTVTLMARPPGFGVRTQSLIYEVARCAGIRDLSARVGRSRNKMNTVKAVYNALMNQTEPEELAMARGRKLVDVRKVYYGQTVS